jgi:hypothetical protein
VLALPVNAYAQLVIDPAAVKYGNVDVIVDVDISSRDTPPVVRFNVSDPLEYIPVLVSPEKENVGIVSLPIGARKAVDDSVCVVPTINRETPTIPNVKLPVPEE